MAKRKSKFFPDPRGNLWKCFGIVYNDPDLMELAPDLFETRAKAWNHPNFGPGCRVVELEIRVVGNLGRLSRDTDPELRKKATVSDFQTKQAMIHRARVDETPLADRFERQKQRERAFRRKQAKAESPLEREARLLKGKADYRRRKAQAALERGDEEKANQFYAEEKAFRAERKALLTQEED